MQRRHVWHLQLADSRESGGKPPHSKKKPANGMTGAGNDFKNGAALAGRDSSGGYAQGRPQNTTAVQGKRETGPQPKATRVRFEFVRRAHQRKITPKLRINLALRSCQEERDDLGKKLKKNAGKP